MTLSDGEHQVIVAAEAQGSGPEHDRLEPMIEETTENFRVIGKEENIFKETKLFADSGFHSKVNIQMLEENKIDGYIADNRFRKRDPRFETADRHKKPIEKEKPKKKYFSPADFTYDEVTKKVICPAGKSVYLKNSNFVVRGLKGISYMARQNDCKTCQLRGNCLRKPNPVARQVTFFTGKTKEAKETCTQKMIKKIDTEKGREIYSQRMRIIEPVFANIRSMMRLDPVYAEK